jgi:outer membrane protein TolC
MINPRYGSTLSFQITQPLLKDFGFKVTKKAILVARNNRSISENTLKSTLLATIFAVEEAYWNLVYSIENLKVKQQSLELAQQLWLKNKKEMEVGTLAPVEILSAQAEVATREADILQAEAEVRNAQDSLRTILNIQSQEKSGLEQIAPKDQPIFEKREINLEETIQATLASRPELESSRLEIANSEFELSYARNQLLPGLNFRASYWSPGISGSQLLYKDNDPLTEIVIGVIPGGARNAIKDALNLKYRNWELSLSLNLPLNTFFSRAAYVQARLNSDQARLKLKNQEQQILLEVGNASRAVETDYQRVVAYRVARELAEKKLEAEEKKMKVGLTTNYQILQFQRDLANARSAELRAIIDYNLSLARLDKVTGTSLERTEVR